MLNKIKQHRNLTLFGLLILALIGTYIFEERSNQKSEQVLSKKTALLDVEKLGDISGIEGIKLNFEKRGPHFYSKDNNLRLSEARLGEFFEILSGLKVKTFLDQTEVNKVGVNFYIPDPTMRMTFYFEKGSLTFTLGKKLAYDQSFYMQVTRDNTSQVVLVSDESPDPGVYQNDDEYKKSDAKYKRLEMVFLLTNKYFYDARVFRDFDYVEDKINFKDISIATFRNKRFSLSFQNSTTTPPPPKGIDYFDENWVSFHRFLTKLEGTTVYFPADVKLLDEVLSQFEVVDRDEKKYSLEVYKKYGAENGYFLKSSLDNIIYKLKPEDAQYFFVNIQDFWKKSIIFSNKEFPLKLIFYDGKTQDVAVSDKELFVVTPKDPKYNVHTIRPLEFKKLIEFLKTEANHVNEMTEKPSEILKKIILRVQFDNRNLSVILEDNEVIVVDMDAKYKIHHFAMSQLPFSIKFEDYFPAIKK